MKNKINIRVYHLLLLGFGILFFNSCSKDETTQPETPEFYKAIAAGNNHALALDQNGTLWAWGDNYYGELGNGTREGGKFSPIRKDKIFSTIAAGGPQTFAIEPDGTLLGCGWNIWGQVADDTNDKILSLTKIGTGYKAISAGEIHTLGLKTDGTVWSWGGGTGPIPKQIDSGFTTISADRNGSCLGIKTDATLWGWEADTSGNWTTPVQIGSDFASISEGGAGGSHCLLLKTDQTLWELKGSQGNQYILSYIDSGYVSIATGEAHFLGIKADNTLWAWGYNAWGQVGDGTFTDKPRPVKIGDDYVAVAAGRFYSLALKKDHTMWRWGNLLFQGESLNTPLQIGGH
jgi:alpha-tubulin suppressor-like RCC1 family protein